MGKIILSHPHGNPYSSHAANGFARAGLLELICTGFCFRENSKIEKILHVLPGFISSKILQQLKRRAWVNAQNASVAMFPRDEIIRMLLVKSNFHNLFGVSYQKLVDVVYTKFDQKVARKIIPYSNASAVYSYEDCSLKTFLQAEKRGMKCIYDLPIMYYKESRKIELEETEMHPQFKYALFAAQDSKEKLLRKDEELNLADRIIVASSLTKHSLLKHGFDPNRISVVPYGSPIDEFSPLINNNDKIFRVMFAGRIGPRKGIHYLVEAWKRANLKDAELNLFGIIEFSKDYINNLPKNIKIHGSLPNNHLFKHYTDSSLFVLPSLVEGFGMVLLEAMACGVPILATENTAAPDIIENGKEGFIVPIRDIECLSEKLCWAYENRSAFSEMGKAARRKAEHYSWHSYENSLNKVVSEIIN